MPAGARVVNRREATRLAAAGSFRHTVGVASAGWLRVADGALRVGRAVVRRLPARVRRGLDDRLFYAIFQVTRVENDAYGWRPSPKPPAPPDPESVP